MGMSRSDIGRIALEAAPLVKPEPKSESGEGSGRPALLRQRFTAYL
jgi:hypothetical protein